MTKQIMPIPNKFTVQAPTQRCRIKRNIRCVVYDRSHWLSVHSSTQASLHSIIIDRFDVLSEWKLWGNWSFSCVARGLMTVMERLKSLVLVAHTVPKCCLSYPSSFSSPSSTSSHLPLYSRHLPF